LAATAAGSWLRLTRAIWMAVSIADFMLEAFA
jgi:hypothetical protein